MKQYEFGRLIVRHIGIAKWECYFTPFGAEDESISFPDPNYEVALAELGLRGWMLAVARADYHAIEQTFILQREIVPTPVVR